MHPHTYPEALQAEAAANRQLRDYIARHESFALIHARAASQGKAS